MPRYLHLIDTLKVGGAQTHLLGTIRTAKHRYGGDHRVVVLSGGAPMQSQFEQAGIPVQQLRLGPQLRAGRWIHLFRELRSLCERQQPSLFEANLTWSRLLGLPAAWSAGFEVRIGFEHGDVYLDSPKYRIANFVAQFFADRIIVLDSGRIAEAGTHGELMEHNGYYARTELLQRYE